MAFKPVLRHDAFTRDDSPKISIRKQHIGFLSSFVKGANLRNFDRVFIEIDEDEFKIGFRFYNSDKDKSNKSVNLDDTYSLFPDNPSMKTMATNVGTVINNYPFLKRISEAKHPLDRQFPIKQDIHDKGFWIARLCPAFEHVADSQTDLGHLKGIYRYKRLNGEVVYIGKGNILSRLNSTDRKDWDFDNIEYSLIDNTEEQFRWERYWLDKFKAEHEDMLPFYNKINGKKYGEI